MDKAPSIADLNLPEKLLKLLSTFNTTAAGAFSKDVDAGLPTDDPESLHAGILGDLASQATRVPADLNTILEFVQTAKNHGLNNDKDYLLEKIVQLAASLPSDSPSGAALTTKFVDLLWNNLQHPQLSYLGDEWKYRTADGSNNNRMMPELGKAGSPYARTVSPKTLLPPTLPDPGLIFDELMAREPGPVKEHPNKISSMLFYVATIIIHDIFRTNSQDFNKVDNSSYLDLSPLYGNDTASQAAVRTFKDGMLKPDAFSEARLLGFPPGVAALLISFNRFHNYVAGELAQINEGGRFDLKDRHRMSEADVKNYKTPEGKRDNDLFQTARLITCGLYINVILIDYVKTILNLNHTHSEWLLDPRANAKDKYGPTGIPQGVGNAVSVEFNLIYRWHSAISAKDEQWSIDFFKEALKGTPFKDKDPSELSAEDIQYVFYQFLKDTEKDPGKRTFHGLTREKSGAFKDEDLIKILTESTEDIAAAFGARQVPICMKAIEMMGIEQARSWNVATLNEFRAFFGMEPHKKFTDISSVPEVAQSLKTLYGDPSQVELYPGLVCEDAKEPKMPGAGLCPGFTISKAILADAVGLVRGDRFYTIDYNATTLTNWGWTQIQSNPQIAGGGVMFTLLHRAFPSWYTPASVYAMFPLTHPSKTKEILTQLGTVDQYEFDPPKFTSQPPEVSTWKAVTDILKDTKNFTVPWGPHTTDMTHANYMLSGDTSADVQQHAFVQEALYHPPEWMAEIRKLYEKVTTDLIAQKSHKMRTGYQLDVVADIANLSHAIAMGKVFNIPLKLPDHTIGLLTASQFYTIMSVLFAYVFLDVDDGKGFALKQGALQGSAAIGKIVKYGAWLVEHNKISALLAWVSNKFGMEDHSDPIPSYGTKLIQRLFAGGKSVDEVASIITPTIAASVGTQAQGLSQVLDLLLSDEYYHHWDDTIKPLAKQNTPESFAKLEALALECLRLATPAFGLVRNVEAPSVTISDGANGEVKLKKGEQVFVNFVKCGRDPLVFPEPEKMKLDRDQSKYIHHGWGTHACIGRGIVTAALATQLKVLAGLKNLRRVPGGQGTMKYKTVNGAFKVYMKPDWSDYWPFPTTMKVLYDGYENWDTWHSRTTPGNI